jgi:hypothetical protein
VQVAAPNYLEVFHNFPLVHRNVAMIEC